MQLSARAALVRGAHRVWTRRTAFRASSHRGVADRGQLDWDANASVRTPATGSGPPERERPRKLYLGADRAAGRGGSGVLPRHPRHCRRARMDPVTCPPPTERISPGSRLADRSSPSAVGSTGRPMVLRPHRLRGAAEPPTPANHCMASCRCPAQLPTRKHSRRLSSCATRHRPATFCQHLVAFRRSLRSPALPSGKTALAIAWRMRSSTRFPMGISREPSRLTHLAADEPRVCTDLGRAVFLPWAAGYLRCQCARNAASRRRRSWSSRNVAKRPVRSLLPGPYCASSSPPHDLTGLTPALVAAPSCSPAQRRRALGFFVRGRTTVDATRRRRHIVTLCARTAPALVIVGARASTDPDSTAHACAELRDPVDCWTRSTVRDGDGTMFAGLPWSQSGLSLSPRLSVCGRDPARRSGLGAACWPSRGEPRVLAELILAHLSMIPPARFLFSRPASATRRTVERPRTVPPGAAFGVPTSRPYRAARDHC